MWSDVVVLLGASDQKIILQTTHQRSSYHPIRMSVCKKKNLRGQAISSRRRRVAFDIGGVVVSNAWEEGFCISWELEAANFLAPEKSCQSTLPGPKKVIYMFPSYTLLSSFFSIFPASPSLSSSPFLASELSCQAPFISQQKFPIFALFCKDNVLSLLLCSYCL